MNGKNFDGDNHGQALSWDFPGERKTTKLGQIQLVTSQNINLEH